MATIPLDDLTKALTVTEVKAVIYQILAATGVSTTAWKPGAVVRTIIAAAAVVLAAVSSLAALLARAGFLSLAAGEWKKLVAFYVYGVEKQEATFAAGEALLSNASGFNYVLDPGDITVKNTTNGKSYVNTVAVVLAPLSSNVPCAFAAVESGSESTAFVGEVDALVTPLNGVTVTNEVAWIGLDEESDDALQLKCAEKLGALSPNGPSDAYAHAARTAVRLDGTPIGVIHSHVVPDGDLGVDVYCATASGSVAGDANDPTTDLGAVHEAIQRNVVPIPITERTHSATPLAIPITYNAWLYNTRSLEPSAIVASINSALAKMIAAQPIGGNIASPDPLGKISRDLIVGTIISATSDGVPLGIFRCTLDLPAADVVVAANESPVIGTLVAASITQVPPPGGAL